jgi:hypothetical protein
MILLACAGVGVTAMMSGCYERVVSAHGFGADQYNVSERYQTSNGLDDWLFGKQPKPNKTLLPPSPHQN